uniref:Protein kinase domain-containing protein n=1 Tax=Odontella aurita TaxID=265563 RepID=A0A7S4N957_9STRA
MPALRYVLGKYPAAIRTGDRYGRTALGWYLGGSEWEAEEKELDVEREYAAVMAHAAKRANGGDGTESVAAGTTRDEDEEGTVVGGRAPSNHGADRNSRILRGDEPAEIRRKIGLERARSMRSASGFIGDHDEGGGGGGGGGGGSGSSAGSPRGRKKGDDPFANLLHRNRRSSAVISLLLNQSVARTYDGKRRLPIHFAVRLFVLSLLDPSNEVVAQMDPILPSGRAISRDSRGAVKHHRPRPSIPPGCVALKAIQLIVDTNRPALVHPDAYGRTPLHVLFATAHTWNKREYLSLIRNERLNGRYVDGSWRKGAVGARTFRPPGVLVKMLLQRAVGVGVDCLSPEKKKKSGAGSGGGGRDGGAPQDRSRNDYLDVDDFHGGDESYDDSDSDSDGDEFYDEVLQSSSSMTSAGVPSTPRSGAESFEASQDDSSALATHAEDRWGLLPLHYAVVAVVPSKILRAMVRSHPASLLHTTYGAEEKARDADKEDGKEDGTSDSNARGVSASGSTSPTKASVAAAKAAPRKALGGLSRTPLHLAFSSPYTARLHTTKTLAPLLDPLPVVKAIVPLAPPHRKSAFSRTSQREREERERAEAEAAKAAAAIDGQLALRMEDGTGRYPLHLAAEHGASSDVLRVLLEGYEAAARAPHRKGDLPVHLLLDSHLLMNVEVLKLGEEDGGGDGGDGDNGGGGGGGDDRAFQLDGGRLGGAVGASSLDEFHRTKQRRAKVRTLSAQSARLARTGVGGAVFGQLHGWTSDEDEARHIRARRELMKRANLLLRPLLEDRPSLEIADGRHGMTPLHIAAAFHAGTYTDVHRMLRTLPASSRVRTAASGGSGGGGGSRGYTALDLHVLRRRFPGEVLPSEMEGWHAVRELLFSYEIYPLSSAIDSAFPAAALDASNGGGPANRASAAVRKANLAMYRRDRDLLMRCVSAIRAEAGGSKLGKSAHETEGSRAPADPVHVEIGLAKAVVARSPAEEKDQDGDEADEEYIGDDIVAASRFELSDVSSRLWTFLATFQDRSNPSDHYAPYVEQVVSDMNFRAVQFLVSMRLPDCCASERTGTFRNLTGLTVRDCAHVHCKAVMHSTFYFAGLYDFTPPPPPSLGVTTEGNDDGDGSDDDADGGDRRGLSILLHRGSRGRTLLLRATEHRFTTSDGDETAKDAEGGRRRNSLRRTDSMGGRTSGTGGGGGDVDAGVEVSAMDGGHDDYDDLADPTAHNRLLSSFRVTARPVCVKFMIDAESYRKELNMRNRVLGHARGGGMGLIAPVLAEYDGGGGRRSDRRYRNDVRDPRFRTLPLHHAPDGVDDVRTTPGASSEGGEGAPGDAVDISRYPYAIVLPLSTELDLGTQFRRGAIDDLAGIKKAGLQIGRALRYMHIKGVIHCNVGMDNVIEYPGKNESHRSVLTDFTFSRSARGGSSYMGEIGPGGVPRFNQSTLPPEMFAKLTPPQLAVYESYWDAVAEVEGVVVNRDVVEPWTHPETGEAYVVKCYCELGRDRTEEADALPPLPYDLVSPGPAIDLWSFGVMLFALCTGGQTLFPSNGRTGEFLTPEGISSWTKSTAEHAVCRLVNDAVTQDFLLHLLGSDEQRGALTMEAMIGHPFFARGEDLPDEVLRMLKQMSNQRVREKEEREDRRKIDAAVKAHDDWVDGRTERISSPTLELRMKMIHSSYELMKVLLGATDAAPVMPYNFIVLPYKLIRNKSGRLTPSQKRDVEMAERVGRLVLGLSRATAFVQAMEAGLKKRDADKTKEALQRWASACEAYGEDSAGTPEAAGVMEAVKKGILSFIGLDAAEFMDLASAYTTHIRADTAVFLSDPSFTARKIMHGVAKDLLDAYAASKSSYLYLVDEYKGVPVIPPPRDDGSKPFYPHVISDNVTSVVMKALPFIQMSILNARATAGGISGLVKLIFEGAYPHIPPSWSTAAIGLSHYMDRDTMVGEVQTLRGALEEMPGYPAKGADASGDEELRSFEGFFGSFDRERTYADLQIITDGKASLWTAKANIPEIEGECDNARAVKTYRSIASKEEEIRKKDKRIAELEKALQAMSGSRGKAKR